MVDVRRVFIGDAKITVTEEPVDVQQMARAIAEARTLEEDDMAFMIVNVDALYERYLLWKRELPRVEPFYAVKCNNDETMLRSLAAMGVGFDCGSRQEVEAILRIGVSADRIVYANTSKSRSSIAHAAVAGVKLMAFDSVEELQKIASLHMCPELVLHITLPDPTDSQPHHAPKFGADPVKDAPELLNRAAKLGFGVAGISFHLGSNCADPAAYHVGLQHVKNLFDVGRAIGHKMNIVNIGGGYPGGDHCVTSFEEFAAVIRSAVDELFPDPDVRIIAEPGRFFAARPFTLVANVISHNVVSVERITGKDCDSAATGHVYHINDGVMGSFNCVLRDKFHPQGKPLFDEDGMTYLSTILGPTCGPHDLVEEMGAYSCSVSTTFNGFPRPTPIYAVGQRTWKALGV